MRKRLFNNKGVSPLIATVLLIGATLVIGVVVYLLFSGIIVGNVEKVDCEANELISLEVTASCVNSADQFEVTVNNVGRERLDGLMVVAYYGTEGFGLPSETLSIDAGEQGSIPYMNIEGRGSPEAVEVIPGVVKDAGSKKKLALCIDKLQRVSCS
ncbi:MAG TPA: archaellin/type IV pilin N-terminal domain-containing protein [Candidatus Nanoarchaeia archaeon]|nr:archaellin/type IV pilin N-terminal domain-containing protein [Candidatus Nanoarchaeia archaeon]